MVTKKEKIKVDKDIKTDDLLKIIGKNDIFREDLITIGRIVHGE